MTENASGTDKLRAVLVLVATIGTISFNWLASTGNVNGITPDVIFNRYPTMITPAKYAFAIWSLIYFGMIAFSIYQLIPAHIARFRNIRSLYILSCALNCAWIFFWHGDQIAICLAIIAALLITLLLINLQLRNTESTGEMWAAKMPFGIYFGWVTAVTLVNFAAVLVYLNVQMSQAAATAVGIALILFAAAAGVLIRIKFSNYFYPLAIAWALTAIAVRQSGQTLIVTAAAVGVVACLIASLSFVVNLSPSETRTSNEV